MRRSALRVVAAAFAFVCFCAAAHAKDRALLVGIDVYKNPLVKGTDGCENDTLLLEDFLTKRLGFKSDDIHVLKNSEATAAAIREEVRRWLIKDTRPGDRVFFAYAGHGTRVPDEPNGDEDRDRMDEALAVYDVEPRLPIIRGAPFVPASGYITDDEVSRWIGDLHGRQVVMLFDSCHSGTISRDAGGGELMPSRFLRFKDDADSKGTSDDSTGYDKPASRDMDDYTEGFLKTAVEGVVVISASKADQEAFPIKARKYGRAQGALTYLFVEKQQDVLIPVGRMRDALNEGVEELKRAGLLARGRNGQYQSPQVEIYSRELSALPIFGGMGVASWTLAPKIALHNSLSKTEVKIWTGDGRSDYSITRSVGSRGAGEAIPLFVKTSSPGYLYIWVFSRGGQGDVASLLFPSRFDENNKVAAGTISFPRCQEGRPTCEEKDRYEFYAAEPEGSDVWVALVTDERLELRESGHVYSWADAFDRIGLEKVQEALSKYVTEATTRGGGVRLTQRPTVADWQADTVVLKTHR